MQASSYEITYIFMSGMQINEPVTVLTDLLVSAVCLFAFLRLRGSGQINHTLWFFRLYFLLVSVSTFYGGIVGHGLLHYLSFEWKIPGWMIGMTGIAVIERMAIFHARPYMKPAMGRFFSWLNIFEYATLVIITLYTKNFFFVEVHGAYGLLLVVSSFELVVFIKSRNQSAKQILFAVFFCSVAALVHILQWAPWRWFNHLDVSHVLMAVAAFFFYRGAKCIQHEYGLPQAIKKNAR